MYPAWHPPSDTANRRLSSGHLAIQGYHSSPLHSRSHRQHLGIVPALGSYRQQPTRVQVEKTYPLTSSPLNFHPGCWYLEIIGDQSASGEAASKAVQGKQERQVHHCASGLG